MNNFDEKIFLACLEALDAGEDLDTLLARYPEYSEAIRQLLDLDEGLARLPDEAPAGAQARSETLFLTQAAAMKSVASRANNRNRWWRPLIIAFASLVLVLAISLGTLQASADSLPGDIFYPVKRLNETTQLRLLNDVEDREQLVEQLEDERIREITELLRLGRNENVACSGEIEVLAFDYVQVYGLRVETTDDTVIDGELALGATALVEGYTEDGRYFANSITIVEPAAPGVREPAAPEQTETPTAEPTTSATLESTATETPVATQTDAATPTLRATTEATATPEGAAATVEPTIEATPDDDDDCDSSGAGNNCDDDDDDCDSSGSGNNCDDDDEDDDDCDSSGSGNNCDDDDDEDGDDGSGNSGSGSSGSGNSGSGGDDDD